MLVTVRTIFGRLGGASSQDGFTLIETLMASVVLIVGLLGLLGLLDVSVKASASTRSHEGATNLARETLEDARTIPYAQLSPTSIEGQLQAMNGLANATSGSAWHIERRGFTYAVAVKECAIDDPKDGLAETHESGIFCEGQQEWKAGGATDSTPEDLKRITAEVSWTIRGRSSSVKQVETLAEAGQATGLNASELRLKSTAPEVEAQTHPSEPVITKAKAEYLTFSVSAPTSATAMIWSLNGTVQTPAPTLSKGTEWTFTWGPITGVSDGTYQVSTQASNSTGVLGPPVTISVKLIRGAPAAPKGAKGGFNQLYNGGSLTEVAELQWQANSELDVIGYRVQKVNAGGKEEEVCPGGGALSLATSCIDFSPPARTAPEAQRTYSIGALYLNPEGAVREGAKASFVLGSAPETPNAPSGFKLTKEENGSVRLEWAAPSGGPAVAFYRIYRGSKNYTSRYATAFATNYLDTGANETHEYWVTAVSSTLTESAFVGPVTG